MKYTLLIFALLVSAMLIGACAAPTPALSGNRAVAPAALPPVPAPAQPQVGAANDQALTESKTSNAQSAERMIVYTVQLTLEVQETEKAVADITAIVNQQKGYISSTNLTRDAKGQLRGSVSVRIPATSLDATLKQIKTIGLKVMSENSNANDVTDQYSDLGAQLKNLEATETELRKLLETVRERTGKAEEILAVYNRLTEIRGQIERIKGQMNVLEKTSTLATVTIQLTPKQEIQVLEPDTWVPNRTAAEALRSLVQALQGLVDLTIWAILFLLPVGIVLALPFVVLVIVVRAFVKRRAKPKLAA
ncbi:MAG: DUF4349 domain-containing protein [Chloroflexi bacterium]|nr:DUF4349 domain-containing protein [Chloroflexota bacterium]